MKMKANAKKVIQVSVFLFGLAMVSYPLISSMVEQQHQIDAVATYKKAVESSENQKLELSLEDARTYNDMLFQSKGMLLGNENYNRLLNFTGNGMMGSIEIPKINVSLPIYHGTSEAVLAVGVGHMQGSSLPIGGNNTRTVLTAHRGLPNSKLFTRLDELEEGDFFFIEVLEETLAYQVAEIEVIEPDDLESLKIVPERDLATLVTCHPYGINSHRLIVTGERVEYIESEYKAIASAMMSFRELFFAGLPFIFAGFGIVTILRNRKRKKEVDSNEVASDETH